MQPGHQSAKIHGCLSPLFSAARSWSEKQCCCCGDQFCCGRWSRPDTAHAPPDIVQWPVSSVPAPPQCDPDLRPETTIVRRFVAQGPGGAQCSSGVIMLLVVCYCLAITNPRLEQLHPFDMWTVYSCPLSTSQHSPLSPDPNISTISVNL